MPLLAHLEELRRRLKYSLVFWGLGIVLAFLLRKPLLEIVSYPHRWTAEKLGVSPSLYVFRYQDHFVLQFKLFFILGLIFAFPFLLHQGLKFIEPALSPKEKRALFTIFLPSFLTLFLLGLTFGYFILVPYGLYFLMQFGLSVGLTSIISFPEYFSLLLFLTFMTGLVFELPLAMVLLSHIGLLTSENFREKRRHAILIIFIVAAVVTPPDPFTQLFLAFPLVFLYEIGIWVTYFVEKKHVAYERSLPI